MTADQMLKAALLTDEIRDAQSTVDELARRIGFLKGAEAKLIATLLRVACDAMNRIDGRDVNAVVEANGM